MKITILIGISPGTKILRIERAYDNNFPDSSTWRIWLNANHNFTLGTQLILHNDGSIQNVTQREDGSEEVFEVKGPD